MPVQIGNHRITTRPRSNAITAAPTLPELLLDVPLVGQVRSMDCWYAGACMVAYYREQGPRLGLPRAWVADRGIQQSAWSRLAQAEGLSILARPANSHSVDKWGIYTWLRDNGPIWCAGDWYGFGHVIVLTGISGETIHINDPDDQQGGDDGRRATETVAWFNQHLFWAYPDSLLCRPA